MYKVVILSNSNGSVIDLSKRKYLFIEELMTVEKEAVIEALECVLKREKEAQQAAHKLDKRLKSYADDPDDLLDWQEVKKDC